MQPVWAQHCESEAISESNLRPPLIWYVESHESDQSKLKAVSHRKHMLTGAASVITHQLSLKGKAAADVAEVAINHNPLWCPRYGKCVSCGVNSRAFDRFIWVKRSSYHIYIGYRNLKGSHGNLSKYKFGLAEYITVYVIQLQQLLQLLLRIITQYAISSMF